MKKIIAIILTLTMMAAALSALTLTSSAEESAKANIVAYLGTLTVDGRGGKNEPHAIVNDLIGDNVRVGASWDGEKLYLSAATIDGAAITGVELSTKTFTAKLTVSDGAIAIDGTGVDANTEGGYAELALPLNAEDIAEADGLKAVAATIKVTAAGKTAAKDVNIVLSARSPFSFSTKYDGSYLNGYNWSAVSVGNVSGVKYNADTDTIKANIQNNVLNILDASSEDTSIRINSTITGLYELVSPSEGGAYAASFDICINSLPAVGELEKSMGPAEPALANVPTIAIVFGGRTAVNAMDGPGFYITNDTEKGLILNVWVSSGFIGSCERVPLGVKLGETFRFSFEHYGTSTVVYINEKPIKTFNGSINVTQGMTSFPGYFAIAALRGTNLNVGDKTEATFSSFAISTLGEVSTSADAIKLTPAKGAITIDGTMDDIYTDYAPIGSASKFYAAIDETAKTLNLYVNTANVANLAIEAGEAMATVALTKIPNSDKRATVAAEISGIEGAAAAINSRGYGCVEIAIPLDAIGDYEDEIELTVTASRIYAVKTADETFPTSNFHASSKILLSMNEEEVTTPADTTEEVTTPVETTTEETTTAEDTTKEETTPADTTAADTTAADTTAADTTEAPKSGCGSSLAGYGIALIIGAALTATVATSKKED